LAIFLNLYFSSFYKFYLKIMQVNG